MTMIDNAPQTTVTVPAGSTEPLAQAPGSSTPAVQERPLSESAKKRNKFLGDPEFKVSIPHQYAAQTWSIADMAEAVREQTDVLVTQNRILGRTLQTAEKANELTARQIEVAERHAAAAERAADAAEHQAEATAALAREQRLSTLLSYYTAPVDAWVDNGRVIMLNALTDQPEVAG